MRLGMRVEIRLVSKITIAVNVLVKLMTSAFIHIVIWYHSDTEPAHADYVSLAAANDRDTKCLYACPRWKKNPNRLIVAKHAPKKERCKSSNTTLLSTLL